MKLRQIIKSSLVSLLAVGLVTVTSAGTVSAAQIPYENIETQAPASAAFNVYTGVPAGIDNEANFVRLRKSDGNPRVPTTGHPFTDPINAVCNPGEMFDIVTYVHNGADEDLNDNGNGPAVAHNTRVAMTAPLNTASNKFSFRSTISASNATSVTDTGTLNCEKNVQLELVPNTVTIYSTPYGYKNGPDSAVNGSLPIGSPVAGSGDVWGCFGYRVWVNYIVRVKEVPPTPTPTPTPTPPAPVTPVVTPPKSLPVTGPGEVVGMVLATAAAGTLAYRFVWLRRRENV